MRDQETKERTQQRTTLKNIQRIEDEVISKSGKSWPSLGKSHKGGVSFQMRLQAVQVS